MSRMIIKESEIRRYVRSLIREAMQDEALDMSPWLEGGQEIPFRTWGGNGLQTRTQAVKDYLGQRGVEIPKNYRSFKIVHNVDGSVSLEPTEIKQAKTKKQASQDALTAKNEKNRGNALARETERTYMKTGHPFDVNGFGKNKMPFKEFNKMLADRGLQDPRLDADGNMLPNAPHIFKFTKDGIETLTPEQKFEYQQTNKDWGDKLKPTIDNFRSRGSSKQEFIDTVFKQNQSLLDMYNNDGGRDANPARWDSIMKTLLANKKQFIKAYGKREYDKAFANLNDVTNLGQKETNRSYDMDFGGDDDDLNLDFLDADEINNASSGAAADMKKDFDKAEQDKQKNAEQGSEKDKYEYEKGEFVDPTDSDLQSIENGGEEDSNDEEDSYFNGGEEEGYDDDYDEFSDEDDEDADDMIAQEIRQANKRGSRMRDAYDYGGYSDEDDIYGNSIYGDDYDDERSYYR